MDFSSTASCSIDTQSASIFEDEEDIEIVMNDYDQDDTSGLFLSTFYV